MVKSSVLIIGAGAAGLIAAKELGPDFNVIVLEAESRTGGRMHSLTANNHIFEAGAEFVHGNLPVTLHLLKEAGINFVKMEGNMYRKKNGILGKVEEMADGWDGVIQKMNNLEDDMTMQEFLQKYYPGTDDEPLCRQVRSYAEGFDLADTNNASVKGLCREWNAEDEDNYRIPEGYNALSEYLQHDAESYGAVIHTGKPVEKVEWRHGSVTAYTADGEIYIADKLLVTVPVSLLQQPGSKGNISFMPPLHFNEHVARDIGFGTVIKVILKFKHPFWQDDTGFILSEEKFPTWWTQLPDKSPVLTGWLGGPKAAMLSDKTNEQILVMAMESLAAIFDKSLEELEKELERPMVFNWQNNIYARGAYSYATIHAEHAKKVISTPAGGTVFFAGEALYTGDHPGTVEAALVSGIATASLIKNTLISV